MEKMENGKLKMENLLAFGESDNLPDGRRRQKRGMRTESLDT
jgi:hypothetical protein